MLQKETKVNGQESDLHVLNAVSQLNLYIP